MAVANKSPQQLEDELVEKMLSTYRNLSSGHPSSFFTATKDFTKTRTEWTYVCHAPLARWTQGHDVLFTACPCAKELDLAYIQWLINGPFRGFSDKISLVQHATGLYYLKVDELDKWPANVLYSFCIATRMPMEHHMYLERWAVFKDAGIDPSLAFLLAINSITLDDPPTAPWDYKVRGANMGVGNYNHHWFDTKLSWARVINGDVIADLAPAKSFKVNPQFCKPCNQIWYGKSPQAEFTALLKKDVSELCDIFGLPGKEVPVIMELKAPRKRGSKIAIEEAVINPMEGPVVIQKQNWVWAGNGQIEAVAPNPVVDQWPAWAQPAWP